MSITTTLTHSSEAWKFLRGLVCLYKPPGYPAPSLLGVTRHKLAADLNCMERSVDTEDGHLLSDGSEQGLTEVSSKLVSSSQTTDILSSTGITDYSSHPFVLGDPYDYHDFEVSTVNKLGDRVSGLLLLGINDPRLVWRLRRAKLLTTLQVRGEFGRATRTGWADGKTAMCKGWQYLRTKEGLLASMLTNISAAHQARAWSVAEVGVDTQEAFELASRGPVRPKLLTETLIYNIELKEFRPPHFMLEVQCVEGENDPQQSHIVRLVEEVALKCRTVAHVSSIRCSALGPWTADSALLSKHVSLQNVLDNISVNRKLYKEFLAKPRSIFNSNIKHKKSKYKSKPSASKHNHANKTSDSDSMHDSRFLETL